MKATVEDIKILLTLEEFPCSYKNHYACVRFYEKKGKDRGWWDTLDVEEEGKRLKEVIGSATSTWRFARLVTRWSGPTGNLVWSKLKNNQSQRKIAEVVKNAANDLAREDIESAISEITSLTGLWISAGSKILRMLSPEQVGAYDRVLQGRFDYPNTLKGYAEGYAEFCRDCKNLAAELKKCGIKNPIRENGVWFVADVEAAIFQRYRRCKAVVSR